MTPNELYGVKENCCGCGACANACPSNAITMIEDEYGFIYPNINETICINCQKCKKQCQYQCEVKLSEPVSTYAAMSSDKELLLKSASGGVFASIARAVINKGGLVAGCAMVITNNGLEPKHIMIDNIKDIEKLQGSKYVQSNMGDIYLKIKKELETGKFCLFSGTPCQVGGLKGFLGNKSYANLLTIDIICHGTPSIKMFQDYLKVLSRNVKGRIVDFRFRDKENGWGLKASVSYKKNNGKICKKMLPVQLSSYYKLFLESHTYRINCYSCKYAGKNRIGDITIGDFWGIEQMHPNYLITNGGELDDKQGISCMMLNTQQGRIVFASIDNFLIEKVSTFEKVAKQNEQLNYPSKVSDKREYLLELYKEKGYSEIDKQYYKKLGLKKYVYSIWNVIPSSLQISIKKNLGR